MAAFHRVLNTVFLSGGGGGQAKIFFFSFSGATFHIPLTKSATLNRLLHSSLWWFLRALFFFAFRGQISPEPPCIFFPGGGGVEWMKQVTAIDRWLLRQVWQCIHIRCLTWIHTLPLVWRHRSWSSSPPCLRSTFSASSAFRLPPITASCFTDRWLEGKIWNTAL